MVPAIVTEIGNWLDRFSDVLNHWEDLLASLERAYLQGDHLAIAKLCEQGQSTSAELQFAIQDRTALLTRAREMGLHVSTLRQLSKQMFDQWPALWTHRMDQLELQLNRVHRLSMSVWIASFQSHSFVADLLKLLATGQADQATYSSDETLHLEGGYLVNEAA